MVLNNEDQPNIIIESQNYSRDELGLLIRQNHYNHFFSVLNINIRSLLKNKAQLEALLYELNSTNKLTFDVITIQESWLNENLQQLANFEDYQLVCKHKPTTKEGGGLCIYVKNGINYKIRNDITFLNNNVSYYDCLFIEILNNTHNATHKHLLIGSIYRSPDPNTHNLFTQDLDQIIKENAK